MLTCPCNVDPLSPHVHIVKLGFTVVKHYFLIFAQNIDRGYTLEPASLRRFLHVPTNYLQSKSKKNIKFFNLKVTIFTAVKYCSILHWRVILMGPGNAHLTPRHEINTCILEEFENASPRFNHQYLLDRVQLIKYIVIHY